MRRDQVLSGLHYEMVVASADPKCSYGVQRWIKQMSGLRWQGLQFSSPRLLIEGVEHE